MSDRIMDMGTACRIIASIYTRDDDVAGYTIHEGASIHHPASYYDIGFTMDDWVTAWGVIRRAAGLSTETVAQTVAGEAGK